MSRVEAPHRGPGRPSGGPDTRLRILEAAAVVFAREGFAGASTRTLAAEAGVNISTLAWHFHDKQGLYEAVIDRVYERLLAVELDLDTLPVDPAGRVRMLVARLWRVARAHRIEVRMLLRHVVDTTRLPEHVQARWLGRVLERSGEAIGALDLPPGDHRLALLSINHLLARYAVSDDADLALFVSGDIDAAIEAHLGDVACRLLGVVTPAGGPPPR